MFPKKKKKKSQHKLGLEEIVKDKILIETFGLNNALYYKKSHKIFIGSISTYFLQKPRIKFLF